AVLALMWLLLSRTRLGLFVRAVTQNRGMASSLGVPTVRVDMLAFGLGSGIAGLAGCALSQIGNVAQDVGQVSTVHSSVVAGARDCGDRPVRRLSDRQSRRGPRKRTAYLRLLGHADRQDHVLRDRRAGDGFDLGLHGHSLARPWPLFRARRLRDGDVPDARDRP